MKAASSEETFCEDRPRRRDTMADNALNVPTWISEAMAARENTTASLKLLAAYVAELMKYNLTEMCTSSLTLLLHQNLRLPPSISSDTQSGHETAGSEVWIGWPAAM